MEKKESKEQKEERREQRGLQLRERTTDCERVEESEAVENSLLRGRRKRDRFVQSRTRKINSGQSECADAKVANCGGEGDQPAGSVGGKRNIRGRRTVQTSRGKMEKSGKGERIRKLLLIRN